MKHINEVRMSGNVGKIDFKETTKTAVLNISMAVNQNRKVNDLHYHSKGHSLDL